MAENRVITSMRLPQDLLDWLRQFAEGHNISNTRVVEDLLTALREGRLLVQPRSGPSAFPREESEAGSTPSYPILIAPGLPLAEDPARDEGNHTIGVER